VELEGGNVLTQRERERNIESIYSKQQQHRFLWKRGQAGVQEPCPSCSPTMKGRLKGAWILSLLLAGLFQPNLGQEQQEILTGLQLSHQHDEARSCLRTQPIPDQAKLLMKLNSQFHFSGWSLGYRQIELELVWESGAHIRAHGSRTIVSCTVFQVDCYDSVQGSAHDYGALSLSELNALQTSLGIDRLVILGFPCNQFGKQEPGQNSEILQGIKHVRPGGGFVPNFQLFQKGDVNGENEQRIYTFLKNSCPPVVESFGDPAKLFWSPMKIHDIKWNFEKFLVNPQGKPVMRWFQRTNVSSVKNDIIRYMRKNG
ncbi:hypothetical protein Chor_010995, partial [Crotalus horridus]